MNLQAIRKHLLVDSVSNYQMWTVNLLFLIFFAYASIFFSILGQTNITVRKQFKEPTTVLTHHLVKGASKGRGLQWLEELVDDFGHRHTCSSQLENAIDFNLRRLKGNGFDEVHTETVQKLPKWVRGDDSARMIEPRELRLNPLAIMGGGSGMVRARVVVLTELEQLESMNVSGKIVLFAQEWRGYWPTQRYRKSAGLVEKAGGVGVLVKSVSPFSLSTPHTGSGYNYAKIPIACIPLEEAELMKRLFMRGKQIVVEMDIKSRMDGTCSSRNTVFDIRGSIYPEQIVLLSAHMDSWDVGQGAMDDGGGMAAVWQAMDTLKRFAKLDRAFVPKRTIRAVFWTAEEQGLLGAAAYYKAHQDGSERFVFVSETDQGAFKPETYKSVLKFSGTAKQRAKMQEIVHLLNVNGIPLSLEMNTAEQGDVQFWADDGVAAVNYVAEKGVDYYFYFHHTNADYLNIFKEGDVDYTAAIFSTLAYTIANIDDWP